MNDKVGPRLLIAVVGAIGSGKSTLLRAIAESELLGGRSVDGFVALAGSRSAPDRGAERYEALWLRDGHIEPWLERVEGATPPYRFRPDLDDRLDAWLEEMAQRPPPELIVLDEFSKFEAEGDGLARLFHSPAVQRTSALALAVRDGYVQAIEERLGQTFDAIVRADDPDAERQLRALLTDRLDWATIGAFGFASGIVEMTLGSALHAAQIPFSGFFLAALQASVLTVAAPTLTEPARVAWVSIVAAGLKALSPAGSRVRPALAITVQGVLFSLAIRALGLGRAGIALGGALVGAWAAAQGFLLQWLFVGSDLFKAYAWLQDWALRTLHVRLPELAGAVLALVAVSACLSAGAALMAHRPESRVRHWLRQSMRSMDTAASSPQPPKVNWSARLARDLIRPGFWAPIIVVAALAYASHRSIESALWVALRAVAVAAVLFGAVHAVDLARLFRNLRRRGKWGPALAMETALIRKRG